MPMNSPGWCGADAAGRRVEEEHQQQQHRQQQPEDVEQRQDPPRQLDVGGGSDPVEEAGFQGGRHGRGL